MKFLSQRVSDPIVQGALLIILSEGLLAVMAAIIKGLAEDIGIEQVVFARNLAGLLVVLPLVARYGISSVKTSHLEFHLLRGLVGFGAMYCFFWVIAHMPLADAFLVKLTSPFFMPLIAFWWLNESVHKKTIIAIALGFIGTYFVLQPGQDAHSGNAWLPAAVALLGAILAALAKVTIRRMSATESSTTIVFYFALIATLTSSPMALMNWHALPLSTYGWLALIGLLATLGQLSLTKAYRLAPPGKIGVYVYSTLIYGVALGWLFWDEIPTASTWIGASLIVLAGVINLYRKRPSR